MSVVEIAGVSKRYGDAVALDDVTVTIAEGEFFALLGPSGSGKTSLLRAIAGFVRPEAGLIRVDGEDVRDVAVHRRGIGMVFQHYALFPHMNVFDNVAFGLSVRGVERREIRSRVDAILELVELGGYAARMPGQLSGGQQQRVALARALVTRPRVLLLDEPLGALDKRLRQQMQIELRDIQREVGITTVFVTHDQEEALTLSDRIALLDAGRIVQVGTPSGVYERPRTKFAASFLGEANFFSGPAVEVEDGAAAVRYAGTVLQAAQAAPPAGQVFTLAVRPEKIHLGDTDGGLANRLQGEIAQSVYAGNSITYRVACAGQMLTVFAQNRAGRPHAVGERITLSWAAEHSIVVED